MMISSLILAAVAAIPSCWDVYDATLAHSARMPHPTYVAYNQDVRIWQDGRAIVFTDEHIRYNDNGIARIEDARFNYHPFWTQFIEPGPPEVGPYGANRDLWIATSDRLPVIAAVRATGKVSCTLREEDYKGRDTFHLSFEGSPHLTGLWVDSKSLDIWKVEMTAPGYVGNEWDPNPNADYQVELGYHGRYLVVEHVTWSYMLREASQFSKLTGEYLMNDYAFPEPRAAAEKSGPTHGSRS